MNQGQPAFGVLLRRCRLRTGLTQQELADRANLSLRGLSDLERGVRRTPHADTVDRLAAALELGSTDRAILQASRRRPAGTPLSTGMPDLGSSADGHFETTDSQTRSYPFPWLRGALPLVGRHADVPVTPARRAVDPLPKAAALAPSSNLPVQLTSFVGREPEVTEVRRLLASVRLLTLTGAGGVGKTRLALQAAAESHSNYSQGVSFIDLAPLEEGELVPRAVASVLGIHDRRSQSILDSVIAYLSSRRMLLVLDNCEHLVDACAELAEEVLRSCSFVRLLATSRESLRVGGEVIWRVPSLQVPDGTRTLSMPELLTYPAVQLFVERAQTVQPSPTLTAEDAAVVAAICVRLDGLPLAVELAAARLRTLSVAQIFERLDDTFRLLIGGRRAAPRRQQTLRAALDWSHDLLSPVERVLFRRVSVFTGGFNVEAAEQVCAGGPVEQPDVLELLTSLVDKSVVTIDHQAGTTRFRLLEPVKQYAHERLQLSGEIADVRERHALFFLEFAERRGRDSAVGGPQRQLARKTLDQELPNLRAALHWCLETANPEVGLRLGQALANFWRARGLDDATTRFVESLTIRRELDDRTGIAASLEGLAAVAAGRGQRQRALLLAGAAEALRLAVRAPLPPIGDHMRDRWLVPLRLALRDAPTALGMAEGRALGLEQAVALARGELSLAVERTERQAGAASPGHLLTRREREVAVLLTRGLSNRQIAEQLVITQRTVAAHVEHLLNKLCFASRHQVGAWAAEHGLSN